MTARRTVSASDVVFFLLLLGATLVILVPFVWAILSSFKDNADIFTSSFNFPSEWRWENYRDAWVGGRFNRYVGNSILIAIPTVLMVLVFASAAGYAFAKLVFPGRDFIFYAFLFGLTVPTFALLINLYYTLNTLGLVDKRMGVVFAEVAGGIPLGVFIMRQFFREVANEYLDAARIDGANEFQIFGRIMMPMAKPAIYAVAIFTFMSTWNAFTLPYLLLPSDAKRTIPVGLLYFQDRYTADYGLIFAAIVMSLIPTVLIYIAFQRQFVQGLSAGSLK